MQTIEGFFMSLAVIGVVVAGFATIVGVTSVREKAFAFTVVAVGTALAVPLVLGIAERCFRVVVGEIGATRVEVPFGIPVLVVLGHLALALFLLRRRLAGGERARREAADLERARTRERPRLPPRPGGPGE